MIRVAIVSPPVWNSVDAHRLEFREIEPKMPRNERAQFFAVPQLTWLGDAVADGLHPLVHDVDASTLGYSTGKNVVGEEGGRVGGDIVVHHFEIDRVFLLHGGDPALDFLAIAA